jgi:UDP-N-acetylmuramate dehydrogenase
MSAEDLIAKGLVVTDVPLGPLTTYKAGGPARFYAQIDSEEVLNEVVESGVAREVPVLVLGRGSNLVVADQGFDGLVIHLGGDFTHTGIEETTVTAGAAAPLPKLARATVESGLVGLEFFVGVPGSVGGAVRQNAGCFGVEVVDRMISAEVVDLATGERSRRDAGSLELTYRHSNLTPAQLVVSASFATEPGDEARGKELMREITRWRKEHQPGGTFNAGSVFKNPDHIAAGELIDSLGLKGLRVGGVAVSDKHANFFVADPDASSRDIRELVEVVKATVAERTGTILELEIQLIGFDT